MWNRSPADDAEAFPAREAAASGSGALGVAQWVRLRWYNACAWYAVSLAQALAERGHRSFLLAPEGTPAALEAARLGIPTPALGDLGSMAPGEWLRSEWRLRRFLAEEKVELINVHSGPGHARLSRHCRRLGIPLVRTRGDIRPPRATPWMGRLYRSGTTHHLAAAEFIRGTYYARLGVPQERITTLRGGCDLKALARIRRDEARVEVRRILGCDADTFLIGMVARLSPVKGHRYFLEAFGRVLSEYPQARAVIVGPDAQLTRSELEDNARALGIGHRVHLVGRVEDPLFWAAALDVAVIASLDSEAICRSALEFLGLGLPLVATRVHAIPEIVVDGVGLLVPPGDAGEMAQALMRLLSSGELRASLGEAGLRHVRHHYSLTTFGESAERLFRGLIARSPSSRRGPRLGKEMG